MIPRRLLVTTIALAALTLPSLLLTPISSAQKDKSSSSVTSDGLRIVTLFTPRGDVKVSLPETIVAGDTISGTVATEPRGKDENEKKENADQLDNYRIKIVDETMKLKEGWRKAVHVPEDAKTAEVTLSDEQGKQLAQAFIALLKLAELSAATSNPNFPPLGQSGRPYPIPGMFDGDSANTTVKIRDANGNVIAESPRSVVVGIPKTAVGPSSIVVDDNGNTTTGNFRALKIDLTAPKTSLLKGESTELHVQVQGLQGITQPVPIQIQNQTPQNVNITGGNNQNIVINPSQVTTGGTFNWTTPITGTSSGGFNITGTIPATTPTPTATSQPSPTAIPLNSPQSSPAGTQTAQATTSPAPLPLATPMSRPEVSPAPEPNMYASFADQDSDCCKRLIKNGVLSFQDDKGNSVTIDHDKLKMVVGGKTHEWQFTQDGKPLWIEWMFCRLKDHQIFSQFTQVMAQQIKGGQTSESAQTINISLAGPYRDEKSTRTYYGLQFSAMKAGTNIKEYSVSLNLDEETCKWSFQLIAEDQTASASNGPPGSPRQLFNYLRNSGNLNAANGYTQGAWWNNMYRLGSELQSWYAWLEAHPDSDQSEALKDAFKLWSNAVKSALDQMEKSASDSDKQAFSQMRDLLDTDNPSAQRMFDAFLKFQQLWNRFRSGYRPK
jgi:hypothetical protein